MEEDDEKKMTKHEESEGVEGGEKVRESRRGMREGR